MDPNLFHLDWERTFEALVGIIILSFLVERAWALIFESRWWISRFEDARVGKASSNQQVDTSDPGESSSPPKTKDHETRPLPGRRYPLKEILAFALSLGICWKWSFDSVSIILLSEKPNNIGYLVTAAIIAGGTKGSIKLFHDLLKIQSSAASELSKLKKLDQGS